MKLSANKMIKFLGYLVIHIYTFIGSYILSSFVTAPILCFILAVFNLSMKTLPEGVTKMFGLLYLLFNLPFAIILFIMIVKDVAKRFKDKK